LELALVKNDPMVIKDSLMGIIKTYRSPGEVNTESACDGEVEQYMRRIEQHTNIEPKVVSL